MPDPQLRIIQSNQLDHLATEFAKNFASQATQRQPLTPCTLVVQSQGMRRWLSYQLAEQLGVAAGIDFSLPGGLIWKLVNQLLGRPETDSPYTKERMHGVLYKLLGAGGDWLQTEEATLVRRYLQGDGELAIGLEQDVARTAFGRRQVDATIMRRYHLAGWAADLFDQYLIYRPSWMLHWRGIAPEGGLVDATAFEAERRHPWQSCLWRVLVAAMDKAPDRAMLQRQALRKLTDGKPLGEMLEGTLGSRLMLFGISSLPPAQLDFLAALGYHLPVDFYLSNPCQAFWADIVSPKVKKRLEADAQNKPTAARISDYFDVGHPLLGSLGRSGRDLINLLFDLNTQAEMIDAFVVPEGQTILHRLQRDILDLETPAEDGALAAFDTADESLSFVSCHGALREVEVLHDWLLKTLHSAPELTPKDIVVMVPDINTYTPYIEAVFGLEPAALPYSISDYQQESGADVIRALQWLLRLPESRLGASEVAALLEVPAILRAFGLTTVQIGRLLNLMQISRVRWGADKAHWQATGAKVAAHEAHYPYSWAAALERLMLSYTLGGTGVRFAGLESFDGLNSASDPIVLGLFQLTSKLFSYRKRLLESHTPGAWAKLLSALLADFFDLQAAETVALNRFRFELGRLANMEDDIGLDEALPLALVREMLHLESATFGNHHRYLMGGITFCTLMPMRNIPFKVVALLGMNEKDFPRHTPKLPFNLLNDFHRPGDRDPRGEAFYMFLEAILAAKERLYVSWSGQDVKNNQTQPPSVAVTLLKTTLDRHYGDSESLTHNHPLQPFSRRYQGEAPWITYAAHWTVSDQSAPAPPPLAPEAEGSPQTLSLGALFHFYNEPARHYLQQRLQLYSPPQPLVFEDEEPIELDPMDRYQLMCEALTQIYAIDGIARWREGAKAQPKCAGSVLWRMALDDIVAHLLRFKKQGQISPGVPPEALTLDFACGQWRIMGALDGLFEDRRLVLQAGKSAGAKHWLSFWLSHLALCAAGAGRTSILITQTQSPLHLAAVPEAKAVLALTDYLQIYQDYMAANPESPSALLIDSSYALAKEMYPKKPASEDWALEAARQKWFGVERDRLWAEGASWYNRILWPNFPGDTARTDFIALSGRVWAGFFLAQEQTND